MFKEKRNRYEVPFEYNGLSVTTPIFIRKAELGSHRDISFTLTSKPDNRRYNPKIIHNICRFASEKTSPKFRLQNNPLFEDKIPMPFDYINDDMTPDTISTQNFEDFLSTMQFFGYPPSYAQTLLAQIPPGMKFSIQSYNSGPLNLVGIVRRYSASQNHTVPYEIALADIS